MALQVQVTFGSSFPAQVQSALRQICGCLDVRVDLLSGVVTTGAMVCDCYCYHPAGCNLIADLVSEARTILIYKAASTDSGYENNYDWLGWSPDDFKSPKDSDVCGGSIFPASIMLAHELVHARHESFSEAWAVRGENQVRKEQCLPLRVSYNGGTVPDYRVGTIDGSIRPQYGCDCSIARIGCAGLIARVWCILQSMNCLLKRPWVVFKRLRVAEAHMSDDLPPADDPVLQERIDRARSRRRRAPMSQQIRDAIPDSPAPTWHVLLEGVGLVGGYRTLLLMVFPGEVRLVTNFALASGSPPWLGAPGDTLREFRLSTESMVNRVTSLLQAMHFDDGIGGPSDAHDGSVHFLVLQGPQRFSNTALYFYTFPATAALWREPAGIDGHRWRAIRDIYELWKDIMSDPGLVAL